MVVTSSFIVVQISDIKLWTSLKEYYILMWHVQTKPCQHKKCSYNREVAQVNRARPL